MAVAGGKRSWSRPAGKIGAGLALLTFTMTSIGIPSPPASVKDRSMPFPCQDHACGCASAEQCWRHCCCFTPRERWAWAQAHHVEPPAYAENGDNRDDDHGNPASCCHTHVAHISQDGKSNSQPSVRWVLGLSAAHCGGPGTSWISSGEIAPPPPPVSCSPISLPIGWVTSVESSLLSVSVRPLEPPPRWSLP
jgi:hypothetical protein